MDPRFRRAVRDDVAEIERWLRAERDATGEGFLCNWNVIESAFDEGRLFVVDVGGEVVAFLANGRFSHDIAEVKPGRRGQGHGRLIAEAMLEQSRQWGLSVVEIACASETSIPFWAAMGFDVDEWRRGLGGGAYAHRELPRTYGLGNGRRIRFAIRFYDETALHGTALPPFRTYQGEAEGLDEGRLRLPERAICYHPDIDGGFHD